MHARHAQGKFALGASQVLCSDCDFGTAQAAQGASGCTPCAPGRWASRGQTACLACAPVSKTGRTLRESVAHSCVGFCVQGSFAAGSGQAQCVACPFGTSAASNGSSACAPCAPGKFADRAATACSDCKAGLSAPNAGSPYCTPCEPGTIAAVNGTAVCDPWCAVLLRNPQASAAVCCPVLSDRGRCCSPPGKFSAAGAVECEPCVAGRYSATFSSGECIACDPGRSNTQSGQSACIGCDAGKYSLRNDRSVGVFSSASVLQRGTVLMLAHCSFLVVSPSSSAGVVCVSCPVGKYTFKDGQAECLACKMG